MPYDPELAERMRAALTARPGIAEKNIFGSHCWMLNGNLLCGVEVGRYMLRVGPDREAEALERGIVRVQAGLAEGKALQKWIDLAAEFVGGLPEK